jgi:hypothetical protein
MWPRMPEEIVFQCTLMTSFQPTNFCCAFTKCKSVNEEDTHYDTTDRLEYFS